MPRMKAHRYSSTGHRVRSTAVNNVCRSDVYMHQSARTAPKIICCCSAAAVKHIYMGRVKSTAVDTGYTAVYSSTQIV